MIYSIYRIIVQYNKPSYYFYSKVTNFAVKSRMYVRELIREQQCIKISSFGRDDKRQ